MQRAPAISVVLPVFNAEPYLPEAVGSIYRQSFADFELIAIDDGSTDASGQLLAASAAEDSRIRVIYRENRGLAATLNEGLHEARSDLVAIMNADDVAASDRLECQFAFLQGNPRVAAVGGQARLMLADGTLGPITKLPLDPAAARQFLRTASPLSHPAVMLRRREVLALGGYRPQLGPSDDYDLWLRLAEQHDLANVAREVVRYRLHPGQMTAHAFERVAITTLVAQAAAKERQAGRPDPVAAASDVDRELAVSLGMSQHEIAEHVITTALSRSECLLACGASASVARQPLMSLASHAAAELERRLFAGANDWFEARVAVRKGRYGRAAVRLSQAGLAAGYFRSRLCNALAKAATAPLKELSGPRNGQ